MSSQHEEISVELDPAHDAAAPMSEEPTPAPHQTAPRSAKRGMHLRWTRIKKEVELKDTGGAGLLGGSIAAGKGESSTDLEAGKSASSAMKIILDGVSGCAAPGEVLAIMGPSGSGKTSVLDILCGRSSYGSGAITLDGDMVTDRVMKKLKKRVAYVKQSDLFLGFLTVRDQLTYTALLRLPSPWTRERKDAEVDRIIDDLRLTKVADSPIFMLSGGERKRVNVGTELLTDPALILLDEPTSGLDSTSAASLISILKTLARRHGKTVVTSIHQPSANVFFGFDKLCLLADGKVTYFGTPQDSLSYAAGLGLACPPGHNAADHWMDLLVVDAGVDDLALVAGGAGADPGNGVDSGTIVTTKQKLIEAWDRDAFAGKIEVEGDRDGASGRKMVRGESVILTEKSFNVSWWTQYTVLVHRSMKNSRSAIFTTMNLIKAGAIGLMVGLLWFRMPYSEATVFDRSSYYFFTMTFWVFDAMFAAYMTFPMERAVIFKERASGAYRLSAYFLAKTTSEAPARLVLPFIYMCLSYWIAGVNDNFGIFMATTVCSLLSVLAGESIGLFLGAAVLDMEKGMVIMTVAALGLMVVGGFFVRNVPMWMSWLGYLSPFKYSYNSSVQLVFDRPVPCDGSGLLSVCNGGSEGTASVEAVLDFLGVEFSAGFNAAMLIVIFLIMRLAAFYALKSKKGEERM